MATTTRGPALSYFRDGPVPKIADGLLGLLAQFLGTAEKRVRSLQVVMSDVLIDRSRESETSKHLRTSHPEAYSFGGFEMTDARREALRRPREEQGSSRSRRRSQRFIEATRRLRNPHLTRSVCALTNA